MSGAETSSGGVGGRARVAVATVGLGMVAGAVVLVVVAWVFGDPPVDTESLTWSYGEVADGDVWSPVTAATVVAVLVPVCAVLLALEYWRSWRQKRPGAIGMPVSGAGCLVRGVLVLGAAVVVVLALWVLVPLFDSDDNVAADVGGRLILSTVALLTVIPGAVLVSTGVDWRLPALRAIPAAVAATVGVVLVGVPGVLVVIEYSDATHIDATTAARIAAPQPPTVAVRQAWRWRTDRRVLDVQAAGAGFVVLTDRGVVAVDGTTGAERWHYRRDDLAIADSGRLRVLDDGRTVVLPLGGWGRLHAFDAFTGELLWQTNERYERLSTEVADARTALASVEDHVDGKPAAVARSSRTGAVMWRRPLGCSLDPAAAPHPITPSDVVIVRCESEKDVPLVVAFDAKDGRELWRNELGTGEQVVTVTNLGSTSYGAELVGYR